MKNFVAFVIAVFAIQGCMCKPKPDEPKQNELVEELLATAKKFHEGFTNYDSKQLTDSIQDGSTKMIEFINTFVNKVKTEGKVHEGDFQTFMKTTQEKMTTIADNLKSYVGEDAIKKTDEMKAEFDKSFKSATEETQNFLKNAEPEAKKYADDFLKGLKDLGKNITDKMNELVEKHEKSH